jgi:putative transcriptional regulator
MAFIMGQKSKLKPLSMGNESFGQRLAEIRKNKGYTQTELSKKIGITQGLISDYELDKLRPYHEMIIRFALALDVSSDELLGLKECQIPQSTVKPASRLLRRMERIEQLPDFKQKVLLNTIDTFLKGVDK